MTYKLMKAGIKTLRTEKGVFLEYNGKTVLRPGVSNCESVVKKEFGIGI